MSAFRRTQQEIADRLSRVRERANQVSGNALCRMISFDRVLISPARKSKKQSTKS